MEENIPNYQPTESNNIPAINGKSPDSDNHKKERTILIVVFMILVAIIAVLSFFLVKERNDKIVGIAKPVAVIEDSSVDEVKQEAVKMAEGFKLYEDKKLGINFLYPEKWGEVEIKSGPAESYIVEQHYYPQMTYDVDAKAWKYTKKDSGYDKTLGDYRYDLSVLRKDRSSTIWSFGFGDAGCGQSIPTVIHKSVTIQIITPTFCDDGETDTGPYIIVNESNVNMSSKQYSQDLDDFLDSIKLE